MFDYKILMFDDKGVQMLISQLTFYNCFNFNKRSTNLRTQLEYIPLKDVIFILAVFVQL